MWECPLLGHDMAAQRGSTTQPWEAALEDSVSPGEKVDGDATRAATEG